MVREAGPGWDPRCCRRSEWVASWQPAKKVVTCVAIPADPITRGSRIAISRSCYDGPDVNSWGGENVFDARSKSKATALNGEKYSDW